MHSQELSAMEGMLHVVPAVKPARKQLPCRLDGEASTSSFAYFGALGVRCSARIRVPICFRPSPKVANNVACPAQQFLVLDIEQACHHPITNRFSNLALKDMGAQLCL